MHPAFPERETIRSSSRNRPGKNGRKTPYLLPYPQPPRQDEFYRGISGWSTWYITGLKKRLDSTKAVCTLRYMIFCSVEHLWNSLTLQWLRPAAGVPRLR